MRLSGRDLGRLLIGAAWALPAAFLIACLFFFIGTNFSELTHIQAGMKEAEVVALVAPGEVVGLEASEAMERHAGAGLLDRWIRVPVHLRTGSAPT